MNSMIVIEASESTDGDLVNTNRNVTLPPIYGSPSSSRRQLYQEQDRVHAFLASLDITGTYKLDLANRFLDSVPNPVFKLRNLHWLSLAGNSLTELPTDICHLVSLKWLDLRRNSLTSLPDTLSECGQLRNLLIGGNQLTELPLFLGKMESLTGLNVEDNPLLFPPAEVLKAGTKELLRYMRQLMRSRVSSPIRWRIDSLDRPLTADVGFWNFNMRLRRKHRKHLLMLTNKARDKEMAKFQNMLQYYQMQQDEDQRVKESLGNVNMSMDLYDSNQRICNPPPPSQQREIPRNHRNKTQHDILQSTDNLALVPTSNHHSIIYTHAQRQLQQQQQQPSTFLRRYANNNNDTKTRRRRYDFYNLSLERKKILLKAQKEEEQERARIQQQLIDERQRRLSMGVPNDVSTMRLRKSKQHVESQRYTILQQKRKDSKLLTKILPMNNMDSISKICARTPDKMTAQALTALARKRSPEDAAIGFVGVHRKSIVASNEIKKAFQEVQRSTGNNVQITDGRNYDAAVIPTESTSAELEDTVEKMRSLYMNEALMRQERRRMNVTS